jgi:hypothetical protein
VREAPEDTLILADGFSCKTQIEELTDRRALHTAQVVKMALEHGESGPDGDRPEAVYPDVVLDGAGRRRKLLPALLGAGGVAAGAAAAARRRGG